MELRYIKGLNVRRIEELNKIGITSAEELVHHFPRNYLDLTHVVSLKYAISGEFAFTKARLVAMPKYFVSQRRLKCVKGLCNQGSEVFSVLWFNQPYVMEKLEADTEYLFYGRVQKQYGAITLLNPTFEKAEENSYLKGILPVYALTPSLYQKTMKRVIADALSKVRIKSVIPSYLQEKFELIPLNDAYRQIHLPSSFDEINVAADRIAIEEFFLLISAFRFLKGDKRQYRNRKYTVTALELKEFTKRFGFEFTEGQKTAVNEIYADLALPVVMNRLMQGDVGCGKTAVAMCALFVALKSGHQGVLLAPTEVLARQNYNICKEFFHDFNVGFLSGSKSVKEKNALKKQIKSGEVNLVVGTHAVIQKDVEFADLAMCICDEQHRFGVSQRTALISKGETPDLLVMSATPIPRTLSLIVYGDLDITTIKDKPAARAKLTTHLVPESKYEGMMTFINGEAKKGHKIYFVAPKIADDPEGEIMSVTSLYEELAEKLPELKIRVMHGRMKEQEKMEIMQDFKEGDCNAIVSTTVIEVGVDVRDATVMVIYNAERFGLSQLHQLRGRVGRSNLRSYCFLMTNTDNPDTMARLETLCKTSDGFKIAETDFQMRGAGDFLGTRQSGRGTSYLGSLRYGTEAIFVAKKLSDEVFLSGRPSDEFRETAMEKYSKLSEVSLN